VSPFDGPKILESPGNEFAPNSFAQKQSFGRGLATPHLTILVDLRIVIDLEYVIEVLSGKSPEV
jgi:hypothetical protein